MNPETLAAFLPDQADTLDLVVRTVELIAWTVGQSQTPDELHGADTTWGFGKTMIQTFKLYLWT